VSPVLQGWKRARLARALSGYVPDADGHAHDALGKLACEEAIAASGEGNYGVGAVLTDESGAVLLRARNRAFEPRFASEGHAEMVLVSRLEAERPELEPSRLTLLVSLEPCPMCYARLKLAGIGRVLYVAADDGGGMVRRAGHCRRPGPPCIPGRSSRSRTSGRGCAGWRAPSSGTTSPKCAAGWWRAAGRADPGRPAHCRLSTCAGRRSPRRSSR
jgi:tRNA(Arg) A34 adenosine deaminase TadA